MRYVILITAVIGLLVSQGYAEMYTSRLGMDYGTSFRLAKYNQILNPGASKNLAPVTGLDGRAAHTINEKYMKSFEKQAKEPMYILSIGGR